MNEYSWKELAKLFEELGAKIGSARLDFQCGNVPQNVHLAAYNDQSSRDRFITLSQIAGSKLLKVINKNDYEDLKDITDPVKLWCYSLKVFSGKFKVELVAEQKDDEGNKLGLVYVGNIYDVCNVSSNTCMQFSAQYADNNIRKDEKMNNDGIVGELEELKKRLQLLLKKFVKSDMLGTYLRTEDESEFKRINIEIMDILDEYLGKNNRFSNEISTTILNKTGGYLNNISYSGVSDIVAILEAAISRMPKQKQRDPKDSFVNFSRISELKVLSSNDFDLSRLIKLLEELNIAYENECYMTSAMICRAILDHIPPIFSKKTFVEVANNYGGKSFKGNAHHLQNSLRNIADNHLHQPIRKKEVLPNPHQINFSNDLDVILAEIIRLLK